MLRNEEVETGHQLKDLGALRAFDREVREGFSLQGPLHAIGHEARPDVSCVKRGRRALEAGEPQVQGLGGAAAPACPRSTKESRTPRAGGALPLYLAAYLSCV